MLVRYSVMIVLRHAPVVKPAKNAESWRGHAVYFEKKSVPSLRQLLCVKARWRSQLRRGRGRMHGGFHQSDLGGCSTCACNRTRRARGVRH